MLNFGEDPVEAVKRILRDQMEHADGLQPKFLEIQSYLGGHWDICFVYESVASESKTDLGPKQPFMDSAFYSLGSLPINEIAADHLEVIDGLQKN